MIFRRYIFWDLVKVFLTTLAAMSALGLIVGVARQAIEEGLGFKQIALLVPYLLPTSLSFTTPGALLFAATCVYGRMSGQNEIVALKSLGISPWAVLRPGLALAVVLSFVTVILYDVAVSWGNDGVTKVILQAVDEIAYSRLSQKKSYGNDKLSINVRRVDGRRLIQPVFTFRDGGGRTITVRADWAEMTAGDTTLTVKCYHGIVDVDGKTSYEFPDYEVRQFELRDLRSGKAGDVTPSSMSLTSVMAARAEQETKIEAHQQEMAANAAMQLMTADVPALARDWEHDQRVLDDLVYNLNRLRTEPPRRWSNGFSCLFFMFLGSVVAIRFRSGNFLKSFFACFLPITIVYYPLLLATVDLSKGGLIPPIAMWAGNVVLAAAGGFFLRGVLRY
ncbi:MAG: LptF/LptG family permease [Planctomycetia bacterium]|nr:LptF/LptG family permease [Planctomycetia bacterium]